jgi:putative ABC transport system permease protein
MAGLTAGLAVGILILLWVNDERTYDTVFIKREADIYTELELFGGTGATKQIWPLIPWRRWDLWPGPSCHKWSTRARILRYTTLTTYKYRDKSFPGEKAEFV